MHRRITYCAGVVALVVVSAAAARQSQPAHTTPAKTHAKAAMAAKHVMVPASEVKWGPGPDALPPGSELAVLSGDPGKAGLPFVVRAKMPDGYIVPPHYHPTDENVTVLSGTLRAGMGKKADEAALKDFEAGSFVLMPKKAPHWAKAQGETIIQIHGLGPFDVIYLNPQDDPRHKKTTQ